MALLEAQAAGLPVVAGRSGGVAGDRRGRRDRAARAGRRRGRLRRGGPRAARRPGRAASAWASAAMQRAAREHDIAVAAALLDRASPRLIADRRDDPAPRHPPRPDRLERGRADPGPHRPPAERGRARPVARRAAAARMGRTRDCLSSPLMRAMETARLLGLDPQPEPRLIEMAWGEWEGQSLAELRAELGDEHGGERGARARFPPARRREPARRAGAAAAACSPSSRGPTIFVTHKGVLRALYALATGWDDDRRSRRTSCIDGCAHRFRGRAGRHAARRGS